MVKIVNINTKEEFVFNNNVEAAKFLGISYGSLYYKYSHQSKRDGYLITEFDYRNKGFKKYKEGNYKVEFLDNTAILYFSRNVEEDDEEEIVIKGLKRVILDILRNQTIFDTKFILVGKIYPLKYKNLPAEKIKLELYVHFKNELTTKDKKCCVKILANNLEDKLHQ